MISYSQNNGEPNIRPADGAVAYVNPPTNTIQDGDATDLFPNGGIISITPYTTPNTNDHNGINTHKAITNIHYDGDEIVFNIFQNYWSGSITTNTTWSSADSPYYIGGDITVESGVTLTISSGTEVIFLDEDDQSGGSSSTKCELIVEGTLDAEAATFTSTEGANSWYGIRFTSSSSSSCHLDGCTIEDAQYGVRIDDSKPTIEDCEITDGTYGIYVSGSSADPEVFECDINGVTIGIANFSSSEGKYYDNKLDATSRCIYVNNSGASYYWANTLNTAHYYGVYVTNASSVPTFYNSTYYQQRGNYFDDSIDNYPVYVASGTPDFGVHYGAYNFGNNHFESVGNYGYYIDNNSGITVMAEHAYWTDGSTPSASDFDGSVDYDYELSTPPSAGTTWKRLAGSENPFADAMEAFHNKNYSQAACAFKAAFQENSEHSAAPYALNRYFYCLKKSGESDKHITFRSYNLIVTI